MKRLILSLLMISLLWVGVAQAQVPTNAFEPLAAAVPADDTLIFASIRTDDAFIDALDDVLRPFYPLADDLPPNFSLEMGLDLAVMEAEIGTSFNANVRNWLGDTAGFAAFLPAACKTNPATCDAEDAFDDMTGVVLVELSDRAAAESTLNALAANNNITLSPEQHGRYTLYPIQGEDIAFAVSDDLMIVGEQDVIEAYGLLTRDFAALNNDADAQETVALLPNNAGYNALVYVNTPAFVRSLETIRDTNPEEFFSEAQDVLDAFSLIESLAFGFVILPERTLTIDTATTSPLVTADQGDIDPAFANNIPASIPLVLHSTNLKWQYENTLELLETISESDPEMSADDLRTALAFGDNILVGFLGLSLDDLTSWVTSDYALIGGLTENAASSSSIFGLISANPLDLAFIADASDNPAAALNVVDGMESFFNGEFIASLTEREDTEIEVATERSGDILTVTLTDLTGELPFPLTLQVGVANDIFFIGTPDVAANLGSGSGLGNTTAFNNAAGILLPGSASVAYVEFANILPALNLVAQLEPDDEDIANLIRVVEQLESATISQAVDADGVSRTRATLTLK